MPDYTAFDKACIVLKHLRAADDRYFEGKMAFIVDIFHAWKCHKGTDEFCNTHCNPTKFTEIFEGNKCVFNTSAAEQANAWFGGFARIVAQMHIVQ